MEEEDWKKGFLRAGKEVKDGGCKRWVRQSRCGNSIGELFQ